MLKPSGSMFVNLGDKYSQRVATRMSSHQDGLFPDRPELKKDWKRDRAAGLARMPYENIIDDEGNYVREKSLIGMPWRYALGCIDDLGLILRAEIVWAKPNGLPESVADRVRRSHEQVFHFTRQPRYYSAVDEVREAHSGTTHPQGPRPKMQSGNGLTHRLGGTDSTTLNPLGKLPGSVWSIPSQPLKVPPELGIDHFAAFPMELPRRIILGWSPSGVCVACEQGRRPVADVERRVLSGSFGRYADAHGADGRTGARKAVTSTITGYACACPDATAPTRPAVVLDPFGGTGTTALVASVLGRTGVSVDRSADYCRLAQWRTTDARQMEKAKGKPAHQKEYSALLDNARSLYLEITGEEEGQVT